MDGRLNRSRLAAGVLMLALSLTQAAGAERRRPQPGAEWAEASDEMFGSWFGESEAERQAIEDVEVDPREERRIGEAMLDDFLASLKRQGVRVTTRGKDVEYIESLVAQIRPLMEHADRYRKIHVYWADSKETDARAFPGGSIVVMRGLVELARNEAALVGVLGHELSHIDHGHQLRTARAANIAQHGWDFRNGSPQDMQRNIMIMSKNFAKPFNSQDEAVADRDGATWALELGYDPMQLAELFRRFDRLDSPDRKGMPAFLRTHPYHADRYAAIKELAEAARKGRAGEKLYVGQENLRHRVPRSQRVYAD